MKYHGALHRYIQTEMDFLYISSLGVSYRYVVKIKKKFKHQNKWEFVFENTQQPKYDKYDPNKQSPKNLSKPVTPCFPQSVKITILAKNYGKLKDVNI
jgi:hypothetical protein